MCDPGLAAETRAVPTSRGQVTLSFAPLVRQAAPAVVNIYAKRVVRTGPRSLFDDPFFRRFFGDNLRFGPPFERERLENSLGSGVIVDPKGLIVTNHHVIEGFQEITVILADRREFSAELVISDQKTDLAVLRIDAQGKPLPHLALSDSDQLEVGDLVLAIGNPFGIGQTVTSGIVSATARAARGINDFGFFIQTDAAINPGNSGGALIAMDGRLVGVNTAIYSRSGGSHGIGFAIPSNMVRTVIASALAGGKLLRPWFGARTRPVTAEIADALGLARPQGVLIEDLHPKGPAAQAGLRVGDVVTAINHRQVDEAEALRFRLATYPVGGSVPITVLRNGHERVLTLRLEAPPEDPPRQATVLSGRHPLAGATVANLSPALAVELDMDPSRQGVVVLEVAQRSPAARLRLEPGDTVLRVNDQRIDSVDKLASALAASPTAAWRIAVLRDDRVLEVTVSG
ncbi:MAG: DegQ family serine endoprotease [Kiloniellales bacterium]